MVDPGVFKRRKTATAKEEKQLERQKLESQNRAKEGKQGICRNNSHANLLAFVETKNSNLEGEKYSKRKKRLTKDGCHLCSMS